MTHPDETADLDELFEFASALAADGEPVPADVLARLTEAGFEIASLT